MEFIHESVLLNETIENLNIKPDGIYVDGTMGGGGHSLQICRRLTAEGRLIGIDQDEEALKASGERLFEYRNRVIQVHDNYRNIRNVLNDLNIEKTDGIILDLGVSSYQLDNPMRGFSYMRDEPLDMRMDQSSEMTAEYIVNNYSEGELLRIIRGYGEERFAKKIVGEIISRRKKAPITTTGELADICISSVPKKYQISGGHPAKRTFQAIRIALNEELTVLEDSLDTMIDLLSEKGRLCIITFHSLEDRIVKNAFRTNENPCTCPPDFPVCMCGKRSKGRVITRKPILPSAEEMERNSRSRSAKLRVFEKRTV